MPKVVISDVLSLKLDLNDLRLKLELSLLEDAVAIPSDMAGAGLYESHVTNVRSPVCSVVIRRSDKRSHKPSSTTFDSVANKLNISQ